MLLQIARSRSMGPGRCYFSTKSSLEIPIINSKINENNHNTNVQKRLLHETKRKEDLQSVQVSEQLKINQKNSDMTELVRDFLDPAEFHRLLQKVAGVEFFCGVPDSLLKDICQYISANIPKENHLITANEGSAIAVATGYHLASGKYPLVYLQNSGLGNIVNPLMSLTTPKVYSIPMLLLIGWRGEPGKRDEPQHHVQGEATPGLLASLGIPFQTLPDYPEGAEKAIKSATHYMKTVGGPYCLLVKRQTFLPYSSKTSKKPYAELSRERALKVVCDELKSRDITVSTTGMLSRELFELRAQAEQGHERDFLTVGSMGHASAIALGLSLAKPRRHVVCLDGDGASIMHMGTMASIGQNARANFKHILFNNGVHDSVGGQPTDASQEGFSFSKIADGCGYKKTLEASTEKEIRGAVKQLRKMEGPVFLEVKCNSGHRKDLGRPTRSPQENKKDFMHFVAIE